jgi:hypothetical protein
MFNIPRVNVIESDEGFSVEVLGRTGLRYTQGDNSLFVDSEILAGTAGLAVYASQIKNWDSGNRVDEEARKTILNNIRRAFDFRGIDIHVI